MARTGVLGSGVAMSVAFVAAACAPAKEMAGAKPSADGEAAAVRREARAGLAGRARDRAETILTGANVVTLDPKNPRAAAVAIAGGKLAAVGSVEEVMALRGPGTEVLDLGGATVVPGLVDGHAHLASLGETLETVSLVGTESWSQVVERAAARAGTVKAGEWVLGDGWDQNDWAEAAFPTHDALSKAVPAHPVFLSRVDGHAAVVNARALALAGIGKDTRDPPGGKILRAKDGTPTGVLVDGAMELVSRRIPAPTVAQVKARLLAAQAECLRQGLTGVHDAGVGETGLAAYEELVREGALVLRVYVMLAGSDAALLERRFAAGPVVGDRLTVRSVKLFADGALGSRGAALLAPYDDDPGNTGLLRMDASEIEAVTARALAAGFQVGVHAIGDRANRAALNGFERARASVPAAADPRLRIEHAQVVAPEDVSRFGKLGVIASMQPTHATSDMYWAEERIGKERARGAYAWRSLRSSGARLSFGSDFPVEDVPPLRGIHAAVTRRDAKDRPEGGWHPEERLAAQEALEAFTIGPAYAAFEEATRGTLEPGKLADLVVLSADPLTVPPDRIRAIRVLKTIVGGKVVFSE